MLIDHHEALRNSIAMREARINTMQDELQESLRRAAESARKTADHYADMGCKFENESRAYCMYMFRKYHDFANEMEAQL